jgi:2,3-dihydroxyphenylpropionate 1,2-dioxygenase
LLVHGHEALGLDLQRSLEEVRQIMVGHAVELVKGGPSPVDVNPAWDREFLSLFARDLAALDAWTDDMVIEGGGSGGGEIRMWIAAGAAAQAAGAGPIEVDFASSHSTLGFGLGVAHAGPGATS